MGNVADVESLRTYINGLSSEDQSLFAERCGTTVGYLRKAISAGQKLGADLVIAIERESHGAVRCEDLRSDVDWNYLRSSPAVAV